MYTVIIENNVTLFDIKFIIGEFTSDEFDEMIDRYNQILDSLEQDPHLQTNENLRGPLSDMWCIHWESGPIPNHNPWPDMRLAYTIDEERKEVTVWGIGRRNPRNRTQDFYTVLTNRIRYKP